MELQRFAEHFKQRRIKLGVTQADVGKALAYLKMAGVGSLSQSTICRFESLTLSHNNMVALKPILQSWLERAEEATKQQAVASAAVEAGGVGTGGDALTLQCIAAATAASAGILPCSEKKRKRTSIAAPEKDELEAQFRLQSRPTGDRIAAIAEKLDLKKNVVRVWFCNQRQKHKRNQFRTNRVSGFSQMSNSSDLDQQKSPTQHHQIHHNQYQNNLDNKLNCNSTTAAAAASLAAAAVQAAAAASMHQQLREQQRQFSHNQKREEETEGTQIFENQRKSCDSLNDNCKIENDKKQQKLISENNISNNNTSVIQHAPFGGNTNMLFRSDQLFYQQE
uniref:POU domain protein n=1 Tax=Meloidogyne hapla TaxID=6305 RepID=A0A1I8B4R6_MELHA